jgi:hypothetical protein
VRLSLALVLLALGCNDHAKQCESLAVAITSARANLRGSAKLVSGKPLDGVIFKLQQNKVMLTDLDLPEAQLDGDRLRYVRLLDRSLVALRAYGAVVHNHDAADAEDLRAQLEAMIPDERDLADEIGEHCH